MSYEPTVWQDHIIEHPGEYQIKKTHRGTYNIIPVGKVIQEGTPQNAKHFNKIENALCVLFGVSHSVVIDEFNDVSELQDCKFDTDILYHFKASAKVGSLLGGQGYCYARYYEIIDSETDVVTDKMLEVFNSSTLKVYALNITKGTAELITTAEGGESGENGKSAYEIAVKFGFEGSEEKWLESLKGEQGERGVDGSSGVYVGSGDMPENCNVQIDPEGEIIHLDDALKELGVERVTIVQMNNAVIQTCTLMDKTEYRYVPDEIHVLNILLPEVLSQTFESSVVFRGGDTPTSLTCPSQIKWSGDDVASVTNIENGTAVTYNCLVPQKNKTYNVIFWYDGFNVNAVARGVSDE